MNKLLFILFAMLTIEAFGALEVDENNVAKCNQKDADAGMTYAIIACNAKQTDKSDLKMNQVYKQLIADIKKEKDINEANKSIAHLKSTQRAWIKYRDAQCVYNQEGGQLESLRLQSCIDKMTTRRTQELKETRCEEGAFTQNSVHPRPPFII